MSFHNVNIYEMRSTFNNFTKYASNIQIYFLLELDCKDYFFKAGR
jgi:hypothetical protein